MKYVIPDILIFIHMFIIIIILPSLIPHFFSSSCSSSCYWCPSKFVDSIFVDVNECTESTNNCGMHFICVNTPGSFGCRTTTEEKAVRVRNHCIMCSWIFLTFKKINSSQCNLPPPLAMPKENETNLNRSDVVEKEEGTIEFSFLSIFFF